MNVPNWTKVTNQEVLDIIDAEILRLTNVLENLRSIKHSAVEHDKLGHKLSIGTAPCSTGFSVYVEEIHSGFDVELSRDWCSRQSSDVIDNLIPELEKVRKYETG